LATGGDKRRKLKNKRDYKNKSQNTDWHVKRGSCKLCTTEIPTSHSQKKIIIPTASATHGSKSPAVQVTPLCPSSFKPYKLQFGWG
jgi:hypothetical protein